MLKNPHEGFDIKNFISFISGDTRLAANWKLKHIATIDLHTILQRTFTSTDFLALPVIINITSHPAAIKQKLYLISIQQMHVATLLSAAVPVVANCQLV